MHNSPLVSVIINCFNGERFLHEAIESVYAQTYTNWEIIFWDNASTDQSAAIAKGHDNKLKYFCSEETVSLGSARNLAIEKSQGEFVAFLDSDDIWLPQKLEKQVPLFDDPKVGLVFSDAYFFNQKEEVQRYTNNPYWTGACFPELLENYYLIMPTIVIRKSALDSLDAWFDTRFNMIEEADLARRIAYNWNLAMVNEPLAKWRMHEQSLTYKKHFLFSKENLLMVEKYKELFPDFTVKYENQMNKIINQSLIDETVYFLLDKRGNEARKSLSGIKTRNVKGLLLYLLTYAPSNISKSLITYWLKRKNIMIPQHS